uniref:hypothetical protein n=1 Tax=Dysgonomonas sp. ZJ279 TaxID=2709796 RepID=UPI001C8794C7
IFYSKVDGKLGALFSSLRILAVALYFKILEQVEISLRIPYLKTLETSLYTAHRWDGSYIFNLAIQTSFNDV